MLMQTRDSDDKRPPLERRNKRYRFANCLEEISADFAKMKINIVIVNGELRAQRCRLVGRSTSQSARVLNQLAIVIIVFWVMRGMTDDTGTMEMVMVMLTLRLWREQMQPFAKERNAGEVRQYETAQKSSTFQPHITYHGPFRSTLRRAPV
jgi:hypothetical protein